MKNKFQKIGFLMTMMAAFVIVFNCSAQTKQAGGMEVAFERYESYFEKNNSGLKGERSYLTAANQKQFDKVFGAGATMGTNSFLPPDTFNSKLVIAAIKRGAMRHYTDVKVTADKGKLFVSYNTTDDPPSSATFSSPLILAVDKGKYKEVVFIENGKKAGTVKL